MHGRIYASSRSHTGLMVRLLPSAIVLFTTGLRVVHRRERERKDLLGIFWEARRELYASRTRAYTQQEPRVSPIYACEKWMECAYVRSIGVCRRRRHAEGVDEPVVDV